MLETYNRVGHIVQTCQILHVFAFLANVRELLRVAVDCEEVLSFGVGLEHLRVAELDLRRRAWVLPTLKHVVHLLSEIVDFCDALQRGLVGLIVIVVYAGSGHLCADKTVVAVACVSVAVGVLLWACVRLSWLHELLVVHYHLACGSCNSCKIGLTGLRKVGRQS